MKRMTHRVQRAMGLVGAGAFCWCASAASIEHPGQSGVDISQRLGVAEFSIQDLGQNLLDGRQPGKEIALDMTVGGVPKRLVLHPYNMAPDLVVLEQLADGSMRYVPPSQPRTYRGIIEGEDDSIVAASLTADGGLIGILQSGEEVWGFQPLAEIEPAADVGQHVVYRQQDIVIPPGLCGVITPPAGVDGHVEPLDEGGIAGSGFSGGVQVDIAFDADFEFYQLNGSSTPNTVADITAVMNGVEALYHREVGIAFRITTILVRTAEPDPYSSSVAGTLLTQMQAHWNASQGAIVRDHAQLMTGKNLGATIGIAFLNTVCSNLAGSYSVVQSRWQTNFAARISLSGHEIGHSFDADHCDGAAANCGMMCSSIAGCAGSITSFDTFNIPRVVAKRNSAACISALVPLGACCVGSTCTQVSAGECTAAGGTWTAGVPCAIRSTYSASPAVAIPDGNAVGVTTVINVPDSFTISDLNVRLNIPHTWVGDLVVELSHNGGTFRRLVDRIGLPAFPPDGCPANNLVVWLDDEATGGPIDNICFATGTATASGPSFLPQNTLGFFDGQNASGTWTLRVIDPIAPDSGNIASWSLDFERAGTTICVPTGSCCVGTSCSQTTLADCNTAGGTWTQGQACFTDAVFSANPNLAIPDGPPAGVSHVINVPANFTISDLNLNLVINHTWVGDLTVRLNHGATTVTLIDRPGVPASQFGCDGNNYNIVLDDEGNGGSIEVLCAPGGVNPPSPPSYTPNNPLAAFDGQNITGNWTLTVTDTVTPDAGTLVSWGLVAPDPATSVCSGAPCPANIVTSGASATNVDIDDLLAVISAWGPCPAPPAPCPANIVTSGASATNVDIDDLLAVISAWGPCP